MTVDWSPYSFGDAIAWLDSHVNLEKSALLGPPPSSKPQARLERLRRLVELMGDPHQTFETIHVTGTNGKTSTSRMISALLTASGLRSGLYTSPHLERLNERISFDLVPIADDELAEVLHSVALLESMLGDEKLSYFEIMTGAAFRAFADAPVNAAVIEVGVGGTYDATNIVEGRVSVVTNIGLDHTNYLGTTHQSIATNKAGIIKPGSIAVIGEPSEELADTWQARQPSVIANIDKDFEVLDSRVAIGGRAATLRTPSTTYEDVFIAMHGAYQATNAAIALTAVEGFFGRNLDEKVVRAAFEQVRSPGRLEIVHSQPLLLVDGAHNRDGAAVLQEALDEDFVAFESRILILAMLSPHDPVDFLNELNLKAFKAVVVTAVDWPRAINTGELAAAVTSAGGAGVRVVEAGTVGEAVERALGLADDDDLIVAAGSLYLAGDIKKDARLRFT